MHNLIDDLSLIVADVLEMDTQCNEWFIFCKQSRDKKAPSKDEVSDWTFLTPVNEKYFTINDHCQFQ